MKFRNTLDVDIYPNSTIIEELVNEWDLRIVDGLLELVPCEFRSDRICLLFNGVLYGRKTIRLAWALDESIFQLPALAKMLKEVAVRFLGSIMKMETRSFSICERHCRDLPGSDALRFHYSERQLDSIPATESLIPASS